MASKTPSRNASPDRRTQILEAALTLVAQGGVDSVSHRRVAEAAGVPLGSTTYYFASRAHLLREAFEHHLDRAQAAHAARAPTSIESVADFLDLVTTVVAHDLEDGPRLLAEYEMTLYAARDAELAQVLHDFDARVRAELATALSSLDVADPEAVARSVLHLVRGFELDRLSRVDADPAELRDALEGLVQPRARPRGRASRRKP